MALDQRYIVKKVREFNRFYMPAMNLLGNHYLGSEYSATEARIFFEIYEQEGCNAAHIAETMNIDKSYLSRTLAGYEKNGYLQKILSTNDRRSYNLYLTEKGKQRAEELIQKSDEEIGFILRNLSEKDRLKLSQALDIVIEILTKDERRKETVKVVPYDPKYKEAFIEMNKAWISQMFAIEETDIRELSNIESYLEKGGQIFFAIDDQEDVMACCMIAPREDGDWELMKFAAKGMYTGTGAGSACLKACMDYAREKRVQRVVIITNHKCVQAVHLYRKFGFTEIPVDKEKFPFERGNLAFEQVLSYER